MKLNKLVSNKQHKEARLKNKIEKLLRKYNKGKLTQEETKKLFKLKKKWESWSIF